MSVRESVLAGLREARGPVTPTPAPVHPPLSPASSVDAMAERFALRAADLGARVQQVERESLVEAVAEVCARHRVRELLLPPGLPAAWAPPGVELLTDRGTLAHRRLGEADGVLTGCALAIAETGTVLLDHAPDQGRRALTLLPDLHICVVLRERVVADLPEAVGAVAAAAAGRRPVTLISGPSATSDIELERVEGVHGPRRLEVVVC